MTIDGTSAPPVGFTGVVLDVSVANATDEVVRLPAARDVLASGSSGRQYSTEAAPGDRSWFFEATVQPKATAKLKVGLDESGVSDDITLLVPEVGGLGLPFTTCSLRSPAAKVASRG